jgi:D-alanine-D-alanine ligase
MEYEDKKILVVTNKDNEDVVKTICGVLKDIHSVDVLSVDVYDFDIEEFIGNIKEYNPDAIFNLCESPNNNVYGESYYASVYEMMGISYTGARPHNLSLLCQKSLVKRIMGQCGIPTPKWSLIPNSKNIKYSGNYPAIIKPDRADNSIGIGKNSIVHNYDELSERVSELFESIKYGILVEEFIDGREISVALLGYPKTLYSTIFETDVSGISGGILHRGIKDDDTEDYKIDVADIGKSLSDKIGKYCRKLFNITNSRDYSRVDVRLDEDDNPYIIEMNPNPALDSYNEFGIMEDIKYANVIENIIGYAIYRSQKKR